MRKKISKFCIAFISIMTMAVLTATSVFVGASAAPAVSGSVNPGELKITMTTSKAEGEILNFELNIPSAYVDWGDGNVVKGNSNNYSGELKGQTVKIYSKENITSFNCCVNDLTELDVTRNTALTMLICNYNKLTELDLTKNTALTYLDCSGNELTELDLTKNTALTELNCSSNGLTELDLTKNTALTKLWSDCNRLIRLDVAKNTALTYLSCSDNKLTELDLTKNTALTELFCEKNNLTKLDVTKNPFLNWLSVNENKLTELDVTNNTDLTDLRFSQNNLKEIDVTKNTDLTYFYCGGNNLTEIDVTKNTALTELLCYENHLTKLDLTNNTALDVLDCRSNNLKFSDIKIKSNSPLRSENSSCESQSDVEIATSIKAKQTIDLSSEYEVYGKKTVYKWFDSSNNEVTPTKSENGVFTFGNKVVGKTLYCTMTNEFFPDLTLKTTSVKIEESDNNGLYIVLIIVVSLLAGISLAAIGMVVYKKKFKASAK